MSSKKIAIFSFFSGSGFLDLGFEKSGYDIEMVNELSPSFLKAYTYSREKMGIKPPRFGYQNFDINEYFYEHKKELEQNIRTIRHENHLIGFIGGPPCPDFSIGGKNKGKDGDNGRLSLNYIDLIIEMKPDFFLFENVKGLLRTVRHKVFYEELKQKLNIAGYCTTERLTNAIEFGVPQDRDRIFLFGVRKKILRKNQYVDNELLKFPWLANSSYTLSKIRQSSWPSKDLFQPDVLTDCPYDCILELTVGYWFEKNKVEQHFNSTAYFKPHKGLEKMLRIEEGDVSKKSYKRLHRWRYSPTVAYGNNEVHLHPFKARRLSASEALAIQSLPKEFELPNDMSLTDMFKTIGNGVPFLLAKGIAESIKEYLNDNIYN